MELAPRDIVSRAILTECMEGRGFQHESGMCYVGLDLRHLGEEKINKRIPFIRELAHKYAGIDVLSEPIPVRPAVHYTMGGIHTDTWGRVLTADGKWVRGLWAAGEAAAVSVHGANRLGSNSLKTRAPRIATSFFCSLMKVGKSWRGVRSQCHAPRQCGCCRATIT